MTKFEQRGVELQMESGSKREADRRFCYSCDVCCSRGLRIVCGRCAIKATHDMTTAYFATKEQQVIARVSA